MAIARAFLSVCAVAVLFVSGVPSDLHAQRQREEPQEGLRPLAETVQPTNNDVPAEEKTPPKPAAKPNWKSTPPNAKPQVLLWRITSRKATVYLLGSIHVASLDLYPLDPRIRNAYYNATTLVTELDVSPIGKEQKKRLLEAYGTYPEGDSLDRHIDGSTRAALTRLIQQKKQEMDLSELWGMRPWYAYMTLVNAALAAAGYKTEWGIEEHLRRLGGQRKVEALETLQQQVAIFSEMPEEAQLASLRNTIANLDDLAPSIQRSQEAWKLGDAERINQLVIEPVRQSNPTMYARLFTERNSKMADAVERYLKGSETVFVVVGAGHLVGQDSVLKILEGRGHKAVQL